MKKILSLLILLTVFCAVSFAQQAPRKTASKAILLPSNTEVKDLKTEQVVRVTQGTVSLATPTKVKMKIRKNGVTTSTPSKQSSNIPVKKLPSNMKMLKRLDQQ